MLKKTVLCSCLSFISLSSLIVANESSAPEESTEIYSGGWTIGTTTDITFGKARTFLTFGHISKHFLFDLGFNYDQGHLNQTYHENEYTAAKWKILNIQTHLGLRSRIYQNLYVTYGLMGSAPIGSATWYTTCELDNIGWTVGTFTGLDFQITRHFLLSAKIAPYLYEKRSLSSFDAHSASNVIFGSGSIGLAYVF